MKTPLLFVLFAFLLTGCDVVVPAVQEGFVAKTFFTAESPNKTPLSSRQLDALASWFAAHQDGWKFEVADIHPDTVLLFTHPRGKVTWAYLNENEVWIGNRVKRLTPVERGELHAILREKV